jgi:hypothetical protein
MKVILSFRGDLIIGAFHLVIGSKRRAINCGGAIRVAAA